MPSDWIYLSYNIEVKVLAKQISKLVKTDLNPEDFKREEKGGGVLFSYIKGDYAIAAYNHPSKYHGVNVIGRFLSYSETAKIVANPGQWAVAWLKQKPGYRYAYQYAL